MADDERRYVSTPTDDLRRLTTNCALRVIRLIDLNAPDIILTNEMKMLNERMSELIRRAPSMPPENSGTPVTGGP
jgi:DNA-directed RNA polymerase beta' subunit